MTPETVHNPKLKWCFNDASSCQVTIAQLDCTLTIRNYQQAVSESCVANKQLVWYKTLEFVSIRRPHIPVWSFFLVVSFSGFVHSQGNSRKNVKVTYMQNLCVWKWSKCYVAQCYSHITFIPVFGVPFYSRFGINSDSAFKQELGDNKKRTKRQTRSLDPLEIILFSRCRLMVWRFWLHKMAMSLKTIGFLRSSFFQVIVFSYNFSKPPFSSSTANF